MKKIAVVDDDKEFGGQLKAAFQGAAYAVRVFTSGGRFLDSLLGSPVDLAVMELRLPAVSGWDLLRILRGKPETRRLPLIVYSADCRDSQEVVRAIALGADDYLTKPLQAEVLMARVAALLRRAAWHATQESSGPERIALGNVAVDLSGHAVTLDGAPIHLTRLEFQLLVYMMRNQNRVLTRGLLLENVWRSDPGQSTRAVDKRVEVLRRKLGAFGRQIHTVSGVGYCLKT